MSVQGSLRMQTGQGSDSELSSRQRLFLRAAYVVFGGCCLYFLFHWYPYRDGAQTRDFVAPYSGARCLWSGCNPYDSQQMHQAFAAAGGLAVDHPDWRWEPPVYPPSALIELLPLSFLRYHAARPIWYAFNGLMFCAAMLTMVLFIRPRYRPWVLLAGVVALTSEPVALLFNIGQPSGVAVGLSVFALWLLLRTNRRIAGIVCLGLGLGLKPQLAGLVFLCLLLRRSTRLAAILAGSLAGLILLVGIVWLSLAPASKEWRRDYHAQVENSLRPVGINDPTVMNYGSEQFTNLQTIFALKSETPTSYNTATYAVVTVLMGLWLAGSLRNQDGLAGMWVSVAAMACIGLLPVYHREYDCILLIVTCPTLVYMASRRMWMVIPALLSTGWLLMTAPRYHRHWFAHLRDHSAGPAMAFPKLRVAVFQYPQPLLVCLLACIYLTVLFRKKTRADQGENVLTPFFDKG